MQGTKQIHRLAFLVIYSLGFLLVSYLAFETPLPPNDEKGLWFYAGLASLLMGYILTSPFFTPPGDAFTNAVASLLSLLTVKSFPPGETYFAAMALWWFLIGYSILVLTSSFVAIISKDSETPKGKVIASAGMLISSRLGSPKLMFSLVYLFALLSFHSNSLREFLPISMGWILCVGMKPVEGFWLFTQRFIEIISEKRPEVTKVGIVVGHQFPNVILVKQESEKTSYGDPLLVPSDDGESGLAIAMDHIGFSDGIWLRALQFKNKVSDNTLPKGFTESVFEVTSEKATQLAEGNKAWQDRESLIGIVAPESNNTHIHIDIARLNIDIEEGRIVEVVVKDRSVLYQVIQGVTKEEILFQKNTRGYVRAVARKIGSWDEQRREFLSAKWVAAPHSPVYLKTKIARQQSKNSVGVFPGTSYEVDLKNIDQLVTHNTAILGLLGTGKSFLTFELIERLVEKDVKVFCFDITNQYQNYLGDLCNPKRIRARTNVLRSIGPEGKDAVSQNVEEGGSIINFREAVRKIVRNALDASRPERVFIFNPLDFEVWRQDSKPYKDRASMASLSTVEVTQIFVEEILKQCQELGMLDTARCCIVFEEAHSLIPEWNSAVEPNDSKAANGIAKAILQGRKYGLGCFVVTQRTANVTKSILNQCNTVFALRSFDSTGMDFLKNYIGSDYTSLISTLEERHAIFFGRTSSSKDPILIQLNNRDDFLASFRINVDCQE
ncbi:MAG: DUF87 domain-containing protein [Anaerolineales bacterium]|nr:MAG: DUF87 domain-containing protein [Anaerolineales bacterium]